MLPYIAEFLGTTILIILGDGAIANVTLNKSGMKGVGSIQTISARGLVVMLSAFIFGAASGAHFNPTPTVVLTVDGSVSWEPVPGYIVAQFTGAFVGTVVVYLLFKDQCDATESAATKPGTSYTGPSVPNMGRSILSEVVGTFMLVFAIKGIGQVSGIAPGVGRPLIFGTIVSIGMSLDGLTGHAISPAHDPGPHLAHAVLPIKGEDDSNWGYASVAIVGSVVGAVVAALLYQATLWM